MIHEIVPTNERLVVIHLTHRTMQPVRENGYPPTPNHRLRWKGPYMELDAQQNRCTTPHGPPSHTGRLDYLPYIPLLPPPLPHLVEYQMQRQTPNTQRLHRLSVMRQMEGLPKITQTAHHGKLPPHNLPAADTNTRTTLVHQIPADTRQWTKGEPKPPLPNQTYRDRGRNKKKKKGGLPPDIRLPELSGTYYHKTTCPEILYVKTKQINK